MGYLVKTRHGLSPLVGIKQLLSPQSCSCRWDRHTKPALALLAVLRGALVVVVLIQQCLFYRYSCLLLPELWYQRSSLYLQESRDLYEVVGHDSRWREGDWTN